MLDDRANSGRTGKECRNCGRARVFWGLGCVVFASFWGARAQTLQLTNQVFPVTQLGQTSTIGLTLNITSPTVGLNPQIGAGYHDYALSSITGCANPSGSLPAGTVCTINIAFTPQFPGHTSSPVPIGRNGILNISYYDQVLGASAEQSYVLSGSATGPKGVISPGLISDVIGTDVNPQAGFGGDGGPASAALFMAPAAIAMDVPGNIYIADAGNSVVRVVYKAGSIPNVTNPVVGDIYTIAGIAPSSGISNGGAGTDGVIATQSALSNPVGLALDQFGNLYISDSNNQAVRMVSASTGIINTVAGTLNTPYTAGCCFAGDGDPATQALLAYPAGIAVDGNGNLYIADSNNNAVRVVYNAGTVPGLTSPVQGDIYTVAGGPLNAPPSNNGDNGPAISASLNFPIGVTLDSAGDIYIADYQDMEVRRVDAVSGIITSVYKGSIGPNSLSVDASDNIYYTLQNNCTVSQYHWQSLANTLLAGNQTCSASGDGGPATLAGFSGTEGVVVDSSGDLYVLEADGVRFVDASQTSFNFGSVNIGVTSASQTLTLMNGDIVNLASGYNTYGAPGLQGEGYPPLTVAAPFVVVPYIGSPLTSLDCGTYNYSLGAEQVCGISMTFQPLTDGVFSDTATYADSGYAAASGNYTVQNIQLAGTGTGTPPSVSITSGPLTFVAVVNEGAAPSQPVTLTNTSSTTPMSISQIYTTVYYNETNNCPATLAPTASCTINVTFFAGAVATQTGTLTVVDDASTGSGTQTVALTGSGTAPNAVLAPAEITFSTVAPGTVSASQTITLSNTGTATLNINPSGWTFSGNDPGRFSIVSNTCGATLAINASCIITVAFSPLTWAYYSADLNVQDDSGGVRIVQGTYLYVSQSVPLVGTTGNPPAQGAGNFTLANAVFPATAVGQSATQTVTLTLNSTLALQSIGIGSAFPEYALGTITGCTVGSANAAGTVCSLPITFTPTGVGTRNASLNVTGGGVPYAFGLTGAGTGPLASLTPGIINTVVGGSGGVADGIVGADGPATQAAVGFQSGFAMDSAGEMFIADNENDVIWKTDTSGNIHLYAGTPFSYGGYVEPIAGEGGTALGAEFGQSLGSIALDSKDGLYIGVGADNYSNPTSIRYIDPATSLITTAVGFITPSSWAASTGFTLATRIVVTVSSVKYLFTVIQAGTTGTTAPTWPTTMGTTIVDSGVVWQNGGVYYGGAGCAAQTDSWGDGCTALQATVGTVAGMILDSAGDIYFSDTGDTVGSSNNISSTSHSMVRRIDATTKIVTVVAGNGTYGYKGDSGQATQAEVSAGDLAFDSNGNLYFTDNGGTLVRMVNMSTGVISTIAGSATPSSTYQQGYCSGSSGDGGLATAAGFTTLTGIAIDPANNIYLSDEYACHIRRIDAGTQIINNVAGEPGTYGMFGSTVLGDAGQPNSDGSAVEAALNRPELVRLDGQANIYIASAFGGIRKIDVAQSVMPFNGPYDGANSQQIDTVSTPLTTTVVNAGNNGFVGFISPFTASPWGISSTNFTRDVTNPTGSTDCYDVGSVGVGYECPISVDFTPLVAGTLTGTLTVSDNAVTTPQQITLTGIATGTPPSVTLLPFLLSFSEPQGGTSNPQSLTLRNNGGASLPISSITITGGGAAVFMQTNNCGTSLAATASCTIMVTFSPPVVGGTYVSAPPPDIFTATVSVTDTAGNSPQTSQLVGVGTLPAVTQGNNPPADSEVISVTDAVSLVPSTLLAINETIHLTDAPAVAVLTATTTMLNASATLVTVGGNIQLTATVTPAGSSTTGTVSFYDGSTLLGSSAATSGVAVYNTTALATGGHALQAIYSGNATLAASTSAAVTVTVTTQNVLTVTVQNATRDFETANPAFGYGITGFVNGDTIAVVSGAPALSTTAVLNSPKGNYVIAASPGTLAAPSNYAFTFVNGLLTVTGNVAQTITFLRIPDLPIAVVHAITLTAHSTSGLHVTYAVTGPATVSGSVVTFTGTGLVTVTASQSGNATFAPATSVVRSFTVTP